MSHNTLKFIDKRPSLQIKQESPKLVLHGEGIQGPQGPPGLQNVVVSEEPPTDVFENLIWIEVQD